MDLAFNGERVRRIRDKLGLSQTQFALRVGCSQPMLSQWESDTHVPREVRFLQALLEAEQEATA